MLHGGSGGMDKLVFVKKTPVQYDSHFDRIQKLIVIILLKRKWVE